MSFSTWPKFRPICKSMCCYSSNHFHQSSWRFIFVNFLNYHFNLLNGPKFFHFWLDHAGKIKLTYFGELLFEVCVNWSTLKSDLHFFKMQLSLNLNWFFQNPFLEVTYSYVFFHIITSIYLTFWILTRVKCFSEL